MTKTQKKEYYEFLSECAESRALTYEQAETMAENLEENQDTIEELMGMAEKQQEEAQEEFERATDECLNQFN